MGRSPAALPVALGILTCSLVPHLLPVPAGATLGLAATGIAAGGSAGAALLGAAAGLGLGQMRRVGEGLLVVGAVAEVEGRVCGPWKALGTFGGVSARLCPDWLRFGSRLAKHPPVLRLDLGETVLPPAFGSRIRARGTLSRFPGLANLDRVGPGPWRLRVKSSHFLDEEDAPGLLAAANDRLRRRIEQAVRETGAAERPGIALARALVLGDEGGFRETSRRALRRAGLAHLFAVSGFNLTVVAAFAAWLTSASPRGVRHLIPGVAVVLYLGVVGAEPSMLRASIMAALALTLLACGRAGTALQALAVAAGVLVAATPGIVEHAGFQLSFAATAGLILGAGGGLEPFQRLPRWFAAALGASLVAQLASLPFSVAAFGEVSPLAPLINLVAVPWAVLWLLSGMAWMAVALAAPGFAAAVAPALDLGALPLGWLESLPPSAWISLPIAGGLPGGAALAAAAALLVARRRGRALAPLAVAALFVGGATPPREEALEVAFLDVGQGDAALVRAGEFTALIDGGGLTGRDLGSAALRPALARRGVTRLDVAILSHSDRDHCQGLVDLATLVPIGEVWSSPGQLWSGCGLRLARRSGAVTRGLVAGDVLERAGVRFTVLHPSRDRHAGGADNAESLVVVVEVARRRFLFAGDLGAAEERSIAARQGAGLAADVLKVSHHGASGSTDPLWLTAAAPRWAVVSAGARNAYGHPSPRALARLRARGTVVLRTDRDGEVVFRRPPSGPWRLALPASPGTLSRDR